MIFIGLSITLFSIYLEAELKLSSSSHLLLLSLPLGSMQNVFVISGPILQGYLILHLISLGLFIVLRLYESCVIENKCRQSIGLLAPYSILSDRPVSYCVILSLCYTISFVTWCVQKQKLRLNLNVSFQSSADVENLFTFWRIYTYVSARAE